MNIKKGLRLWYGDPYDHVDMIGDPYDYVNSYNYDSY